MFKEIKSFFLDLLFPKFCLSCQKEGEYICPDCFTLLDISSRHQIFKTRYLNDLYFPLSYKNPLAKKIIQKFKYPPFVKELSRPLASFIIAHFQLIEKSPEFFKGFSILPIPLSRRKLKWRGFNQAEEIGKELAKFLGIEIFSNVLIKTKETTDQVQLQEKERRENVKDAFLLRDKGQIKNQKIILIDDVYTTGATMEEAAKVIKEAQAKEIIGVVLARAEPGDDGIKI